MYRVPAILVLAILALSLPATAVVRAEGACSDAVTVANGDTLSRISRHCEISLEALIEANDLEDPHRLRIGQTIIIPGGDRNQATGYVVGPGDTLAAIANELRLPASSLLRINPDIDPRNLATGTVLRVPADWANGFDAGEGPIAASGVITTVECLAMRGADGQLYALAGGLSEYQPGDRVEIEGERANQSWCVPGPTIEIGQIRTAG